MAEDKRRYLSRSPRNKEKPELPASKRGDVARDGYELRHSEAGNRRGSPYAYGRNNIVAPSQMDEDQAAFERLSWKD